MNTREDYLSTKRELKLMCRGNLERLLDDLVLNDYERGLLISVYNDESRVAASMKLCISINKYTRDLKKIIGKIVDYKKSQGF